MMIESPVFERRRPEKPILGHWRNSVQYLELDHP